ncbi:bifunctional inhibitor lipid-transfer seed storage 2S albumin superfamily [Olea europaea subsp. europaea]|uniref:Bifunctional inhibitor lipid-transfer seed storage 2S albumin superfamily n=1 Tax=Olea europaea subsp. europaea TaxID=158383 RepID=A0A8S0P991_OLEEU|nr:bifunctional inhibitor lipid-transfer seed storage 2S albumin superfamily [Olea europaea subsp. europaea]
MVTSKAAVLVLFLIISCAELIMVSSQCQGNFQGLVQECSQYVQKGGPRKNPSQGCCNVVKSVDLPCVCQHITQEVEQIISMEKATYVAGFCGKPIPHGTKCGSYTVP